MAGDLKRFLDELRRRKVLGVAVAYAVLAWGILQVSSTVLQMAAAPAWLARAVLIVVAAGFPVAIILAWLFDLTSAGVVRTTGSDTVDDTASPLRRGLAIGGVAVVLAGTVLAALALWPRPAAQSLEFTQLTNFADAATAPALSPDGRMLAFLKGRGDFANSANPSQLYVKALPDGEPVQLTSSREGKATPAFSPDGARIAYTSARANFAWGTHIVSVNGGRDVELLPNASGLSWLDARHVLYSELRRGLQMGLRRSSLSREDVREVYWPADQTGMVHRSAVSPDRRWVLAVEMEGGIWQPCRLLPIDGSSAGHRVGPPDAQCTYAAWSPNGRWMFFSSNAGGTFHLWRQRFPDGAPEQLTHGPTEEEGIAVEPDGRSLITSAGVRHNALWLIAGDGDRQVSIEEYAFAPIASRDGARVYFLSRLGQAGREYNVGGLVAVSLVDGARERLLPEHLMVHFDLSADDRLIAFVSDSDDATRRGIWIAPLDRSYAPRRVFPGETERVFFDPAGHLYFLVADGGVRRLHRLRAPAYRVRERLHDDPVYYLFAISPDGEWIAANAVRADEGNQQVAISTRGLPMRVFCPFCGGGAGPARRSAPAISWTRDGRAMVVAAQFIGAPAMARSRHAIVIPVRPGAALPALPPEGIRSEDDYLKVPGARIVPRDDVLPGAHPDQLFYYQATTIRNLYRVRLPD